MDDDLDISRATTSREEGFSRCIHPNSPDTMIKEGDKAPAFALQADDGTTVTLESMSGKNVVLFFYPRDNTSG